MSWYVVGDEEMLGQFASTAGLEDLRAAASEGSAVRAFLDAGETDDVVALREALGALDADDHSVLDTAAALRDLLEGQRTALLTDGVVEDDEDLEKYDPDPSRVSAGNPDGVGVEGTVVKKDDERQIAFGWFSVVEIDGQPVTDVQGDRITPDELERAAYDFVLYARKVGEMHDAGDDGEAVGVGRLVESVVFTEEKQRAMVESLRAQGVDAHLDLGCTAWWGGFRISDPETWRRVKEGELRAWSIGGRGRREDVVEKYNPDQPRVEAGSPEGGQWAGANAAFRETLRRPGGATAAQLRTASGRRTAHSKIAALRRMGYQIESHRRGRELVFSMLGEPSKIAPSSEGRKEVGHLAGAPSDTRGVSIQCGDPALFKTATGITPEQYTATLFKHYRAADIRDAQLSISGITSHSFAVQLYCRVRVGEDEWSRTSMTRTFDLSDKMVYHDYFTTQIEGKGIGKKLFDGLLDVYDHLGIKTLDVHAGLQGGGYAWARYGFVPTQSSWDGLRSIINSQINYIESPSVRQKVRSLVDNPDPKTIRELAAITDPMVPGGEVPAGKGLLRGSIWHGSIKLSDPKEYKVISNYVRGKKG